MNGAIRNNSTGRVLSFEQKGDFFYKRGNDKLDKNDLIEALCSYRRAMEQEPEDQYSCIAVAEVLSEMERYDDSNRVLLPLLSREDVEPEAIFGAIWLRLTKRTARRKCWNATFRQSLRGNIFTMRTICWTRLTTRNTGPGTLASLRQC